MKRQKTMGLLKKAMEYLEREKRAQINPTYLELYCKTKKESKSQEEFNKKMRQNRKLI
jgi:uncharacterized membrane protein